MRSSLLLSGFVKRWAAWMQQRLGRSISDAGQMDYTIPRDRLCNLPIDVLLSVADWLDDSDIACLALCNRVLKVAFSSVSWKAIWCAKSEHSATYTHRRDFLMRLARDYPRYFFCHYCAALHDTARVNLPGRSLWPKDKRLLRCGRAELSERSSQTERIYWIPSGYTMHFQHIQLAMERYHKGVPYGIALDSLSKIKITRSIKYPATALFAVSARVVSDELYLRVQYWISVEKGKFSTLHDYQLGEICHHVTDSLDFANCKAGTPTRKLMECKTGHHDGWNDCQLCYPLLRCKYCAMEIQFELKPGTDRAALVWTKWLNLGRGESPWDPKWMQHNSLGQRGSLVDKLPLVPAPLENSLRSAFESVDGQTLAELTEENGMLLDSQRYQAFIQREAIGSLVFQEDGPDYLKVKSWERYWLR